MPTSLIMKPPRSSAIILIIISGFIVMLISMYYLICDVKQSGYKKEYYTVTASTGTEDTLWVTHLPQIKDSMPKDMSSGAGEISYSKILFHYNPSLLVWIAIASLSLAIAIALLPLYIASIVANKKGFSISGKDLFIISGITLILGFIIFFTSSNNAHLLNAREVVEQFDILLKHPGVFNIIVGTILLVGMLGIFGQLLVNRSINKLPDSLNGLSKEKIKEVSQQFVLLQKSLKFYLLADAALIVLTILATDALRKAILSEITTNIDVFPNQFVYLYGLLFTFCLGVFYLPVFYRLRIKGESLLAGRGENTEDDKKDDIRYVFLIKESPLQNFLTVFSILSPVLSSLIPNMLNL